MSETLVHRGPDDDGTFHERQVGLAMRRLSIIGVRNGKQPLFNEDRSVVLILNGEIYNYLSAKAALRERGHSFQTDTDAEVAVHLYEEFGEKFLAHLRGMFALALYDRGRRRLLLARDRAGKKPLYYAICDGVLVFGSEIKAIHASGLVPKRLDIQGLESYLAYGFVVGERTLFEDIRKLPAGFMLEATPRTVERRQYWDLPAGVETSSSPQAAAARVRELLEDAVRSRLMTEVPLGAFLSGGLDSSAVVGIMARQLEEPVETFSVGFDDSQLDELSYARAVAEHFGTRHHELVLRGCNPELLRQINWYYDEPAGDPAACPTFCLSRFARRHVTVVLTGEGGDEIFAGYPHYQHCRRLGQLEVGFPYLCRVARGLTRLEPFLHRLVPAHFWKGVWIAGLPSKERMRGWVSACTDAEIGRLLKSEWQDHGQTENLAAAFRVLQAQVERRDPLAQLLYIDTKLSLADHLLMKVDKMSMAASLEARCPLLSQELLEYTAGLPTDMKLASNGSKLVLRQAVRDLVPKAILARPKQGFDVPLDTWLLRDLEAVVCESLLAPGVPVGRYLDLAAVRSLWARFRSRQDGRLARQLWRLLNLAVWHELHWPSGLPIASPRSTEAPEPDPVETLFSERDSTAS